MQKAARKEKPGTSKNDGAMQSDENTLNYSIYLTYDILRIIFQYLDARNLSNAAMVCRYSVYDPLMVCSRFNPKCLFNASRMTTVSVLCICDWKTNKIDLQINFFVAFHVTSLKVYKIINNNI